MKETSETVGIGAVAMVVAAGAIILAVIGKKD